MIEFHLRTEEQNTNELLFRRSVRMGNSTHPSLIREDHKNKGVNRRKSHIDRTIENIIQTTNTSIGRTGINLSGGGNDSGLCHFSIFDFENVSLFEKNGIFFK